MSERVSRYVVTVGNLIQSGDQNSGTLLATIVSVDPMYAYFDVDERTVLAHPAIDPRRQGQVSRPDQVAHCAGPGHFGGFPHQGTINFEDNQVNPKTGTLHVRGVFPNKDKALSPAFSPASSVPFVKPTRPCWSLTARSTPTRAEKVPVHRQQEARGRLPHPFGWEPSPMACGRSPPGWSRASK